jgi:hypothetical protein
MQGIQAAVGGNPSKCVKIFDLDDAQPLSGNARQIRHIHIPEAHEKVVVEIVYAAHVWLRNREMQTQILHRFFGGGIVTPRENPTPLNELKVITAYNPLD